MKIHSLAIRNFRGFAEREFSFANQFNVLIGDNGSGKTAILDALDIAIGSLFLSFNEIKPRHIRSGDARLVRYERSGAFYIEPQYPVSIKSHGIINEQAITWERTLNGKDGRTTRSGADELASISKDLQTKVQQGKDVILPVLGYYGTGRLWLQKKERGDEQIHPGSRMDGYVDALDPQSNEKMLVKWMRQRQLAIATKKKPSDQLDAVKRAVSECLGEGYTLEYDFDQESLIVQSPTGQLLPYHFLSDGVRNMVGMVADIAYRSATLNPDFGSSATSLTPGIILIDEIDLHLHPKWQREVIEDLRRTFPKIQFFASTHSPFIIQSLRPGELLILDERLAGEYVNKSIEDIAETLMGVSLPQRGERYQRMYEAAQTYYQILQNSKNVPSDEVEAAKLKLDELIAPFSDNVGYHAFLEMERIAAGLGRSKK